MQDVSFAIPQRKKLTLEVTAGSGILRARNQASKEVEFGIPMHKIREFALFSLSLAGRDVWLLTVLFFFFFVFRTCSVSPCA